MTVEILTALVALIFVLALLVGLSWAVKRFGLLPGHLPAKSGKNKIEMVETRMLDARNRLMVVRWGRNEYFLGSGPNGVTVIDKKDQSPEKSSENSSDTDTEV
ncbi:flagellar biosynthetic protein FliO [Kordiimonas sp. SCSIO 12610]|uniref:flagellar biosynthetic protein FliO n=1 Tax=Kordiimonas sp. SCSIO 12610 TaxID=2829597 RepID=UPI002109D197|nr:flagellar biosynthetic protein FliO [Kordiimonas sp. SCSIO 12610]UTW56813.1 flagellar biosynthetic protein FliO [Kordiimonas sp. SCSIO 12610]